jgi:hydroxymethylbilane synthase
MIRLGTRGSPLALAQAHEVRDRLVAAHGLDPAAVQIEIFKTTGDRVTDRPLADIGGKGLFTKELEEALLDGRIDLAVHSMKDMQTVLPEGLAIVATLPREDVRDAFISSRFQSLAELPQGAVVGTSSLRRAAQALRLRPDLTVVGFRGNVETRLAKLERGEADATFLAAAGLNRLGKAHVISALLPIEDMLPAAAQGAIGIEARADDESTATILSPLNDQRTALCVAAERAFLKVLEGSCRTPIAALATLTSDRLEFRGMVLSPDGREVHERIVQGRPEAAVRLAEDAATSILEVAGPQFLATGGST